MASSLYMQVYVRWLINLIIHIFRAELLRRDLYEHIKNDISPKLLNLTGESREKVGGTSTKVFKHRVAAGFFY